MKTYITKGVCAKKIELSLNDDIVEDVKFIGGCDGNTKGIESLVKGMSVEDVIRKLKGIGCRNRGTSCPDQLAKALEEYQSE